MSEDITKIIKSVEERSEKFGAYLRHSSYGIQDKNPSEDTEDVLRSFPEADELKAQLLSGEIGVMIFTTFSLNEIAFSDRIQKPEKVKAEDEFKTAAPTEFEILREQMAERLKRGDSVFKKDEDEL